MCRSTSRYSKTLGSALRLGKLIKFEMRMAQIEKKNVMYENRIQSIVGCERMSGEN